MDFSRKKNQIYTNRCFFTIFSEITREVSPSTERPTPEREMPRLQLILRGPNIPGIPDVEMDLRNPDWSIFKAVQQCVQSSGIGSKADKIRRVWEPTYVIVYKEAKEKSPSGTSKTI